MHSNAVYFMQYILIKIQKKNQHKHSRHRSRNPHIVQVKLILVHPVLQCGAGFGIDAVLDVNAVFGTDVVFGIDVVFGTDAVLGIDVVFGTNVVFGIDVVLNVDVEFMGRPVILFSFFFLSTYSMALFTQGFFGSEQKNPLTVLNLQIH